MNKIISSMFMMVIFLAACVPQVSPPATNTVARPTNTAIPTSTVGATAVPLPTNRPRPTFTPRPKAPIITSRPSGSPVSIRITDQIGVDYKSLSLPQNLWFERIAWVKDVKVVYSGGTILLSGTPNGMASLVVDDVLTIKVIHESGRFDTFEYDFSKNSSINGPQEAGPFDLTEFFQIGVNMLYVTIYDYGYSYWGTSGLWLVEFK